MQLWEIIGTVQYFLLQEKQTSFSGIFSGLMALYGEKETRTREHVKDIVVIRPFMTPTDSILKDL